MTEPAAPEITSQDDAGLALATLVLTSNTWIHRRVEQLEIAPTGECVHRVSIDFTIPKSSAITGSSGAILVPIGVMRKGPLRGFSVRGPSDKPIPILETAENGKHAANMLVALAKGFCKDPARIGEFRDVVTDAVLHVGTPDRRLIARIQQASLRVIEEPGLAPILANLVQQMQNNFLMIVEVDNDIASRRSIVKFEYREPVDHEIFKASAPEIEWKFVDFGQAASTHYEFTPPPLLLVADAELSEAASDRDASIPISRRTEMVATAHFVGTPVHRFATATFRVRLTPRRYGAYSAMYVASWAVLATIVSGIVLRTLRAYEILPSSTISAALPSMLLTVGGLLLTWIARAPEDWITARTLWAARRVLLALAALLVLVAAFLAVPVPEPWRTCIWFGLFNLATAIVIYTTHRRVSDQRCTLKPHR